MTHSIRPSTRARFRLLAAFAVLPVLDALLAFLWFPLLWDLGGHGARRPADPVQAAGSVAALAGILGMLVTICGAVPVVWWLLKRGPVSFGQLLLAGLVLGNVPFLVYCLALIGPALSHLAMGTMSDHLVPLSELLVAVLRPVAIGSVMGMASASVFWLLTFDTMEG